MTCRISVVADQRRDIWPPTFRPRPAKEEFKFVLGGIHSQNADIDNKMTVSNFENLRPIMAERPHIKKTNVDTREIDKIGDGPRSPAICGLPNMS